MILFKKAAEIRHWLDNQARKEKKIGFVPTMGALHPGHISLIESSRAQNEVTVSSIFVNPTQFNDPKDFEKYPITLEKDIEMLETAGCDVLFLPSVQEMYPQGIKNRMQYELGFLETVFDGQYRPGHFQGVCTVVHRLLEIVLPHNLYLGQKDYQQCMVIKKLTELIGMSEQIKINICTTLREKDGLAMSSRNMRLNTEERKIAPAIYQSMIMLKENLQAANLTKIKENGKSFLAQAGFKVDYFEIADARNLETVDEYDGKQKLVCLVAAFLNEVRLIDNMLLN